MIQHLFIGKVNLRVGMQQFSLEVPNVEVLLDSARSDRLCAQGASHLRDKMFCQNDNDEEVEDVDNDDDIKHLEMPSDDDVGSALAMFGSNLGNFWMLQNLDKTRFNYGASVGLLIELSTCWSLPHGQSWEPLK